MKEKTTIQKYAYYDDVLKTIGGYPLSENLTIEKLQLSRGIIQAAYKEMYGLKFEGTIIDYLCWVSTRYIIEIVLKNIEPKNYISYLKKHYGEHKEDINNILRLASRKPEILTEFIDTRELVVMWHDNYMSSIKSNN